MYVNEKTKYPELFAGTYWAGFKVAKETAAITPKIFQNRNWFAEHFRLQKEVRPKFESNRFAFTELDHLEVYRDASNRIVVACSNYGGTPPPALKMKPIRPIYSTATESYIRIFESMKEFRAAMRGESNPANNVSRAREKARDLTKHPDVFAGICWGAFSMDRNSEVITPEIASNRNMLVERYGLKCCANLQFDRWQRKSETDKNYDLDHLEVYRTNSGGVAIVCSNYGCPPPPFLNMQPIPTVYTTQTESYVACYPDLKTFRAAMRGDKTSKTISMADNLKAADLIENKIETKVATKSITKARDGVWDIKVQCPYCGATHHHGGGDDPEQPLLGHRHTHCGRGSGYIIIDGRAAE